MLRKRVGSSMASALEVVVPESVWVTERPVWYTVRLRSRTTIVRLPNGGLWVHSPGPPTDEVCAALDRLGDVRFIVVPNKFHHLEAPAMVARYPQALVVGPKSALERNPKLSLNLGLDDPAFLEATPELSPIQLTGVPFLDETVFFHGPTGSLIGADLLISACARDHWTWRYSARVWGRYETIKTPPDVRTKTRPSADVAVAIAQLRALPVKRILVAHADPITERPLEQLADAWSFAIPPNLRQDPATV